MNIQITNIGIEWFADQTVSKVVALFRSRNGCLVNSFVVKYQVSSSADFFLQIQIIDIEELFCISKHFNYV